MNNRCEIWDQGVLYGTGTIQAYVGEPDGVCVIIKRDDGWLMRASVNSCKIISEASPSGKGELK